MKKILLYGIGSLRNKGCEALVNSTINQIDNNVEISAATFDYEYGKNLYKDRVKMIKHYRQDEEEFTEDEKKLSEYYKNLPFDYYNFECLYQRDVIKEMKDSDLIIHIGGDNYCYGVNEWMFSLNTKAKDLGKKTVLWGASLFDELKDYDLIEDLKKYDLLMLREKISYNAVKKYIDEDKLMLIPDPAFSLKTKRVRLNSWYKNRKILGINLSPLTVKDENDFQTITTFIDYILKKTKYSIALLPHVTVDEVSDLKILKPLAEKYIGNKRVFLDDREYNCEEIKYVISKCTLLIAARTHASIAAYSTLVPTLVIGYSVKSRGIAEDIFGNYKDYVIPTEELNIDNLLEKFNYLNKNKSTIKKVLETKMQTIKIDAENLYSKMLERLELIDKKTICPKEKCIGCTACINVCPAKAIEFKENEEGFLYPNINLEKCTNCGLCRKTCPILKKQKESKNLDKVKCYAAKSKDKSITKKSSSGGIFYYLAEHIINENGVVYGATMNDFKVSHIRIKNINDLEKIQGSKYSQSNLNTIFSEVKQDLNENKKVLFSGTPCQILGLKSFLNKKYKNLYTVSVICHGVLNDKLLSKRITEFENNFDTKIQNVIYKSKKHGWDKSSIEYQSEQINKCYQFTEDPLMYLYLNNLALRESCYNCPAKGLENNVADLVLGDYWGLYHEHRDFYDNLGTSAIIVKTEQGKRLIKTILKQIDYIDTEYESIVKYNPAFDTQAPKQALRNKVFKELKSNSLSIVAENMRYEIEVSVDKRQKEKELKQMLTENEIYKNQLEQIYTSKRFRLINKIGNLINQVKNYAGGKK